MEEIKILGHDDTIKNGINLQHHFFDHLLAQEKEDIWADVLNNKTYFASFWSNNSPEFACILDVHFGKKIHIRQISRYDVRSLSRVKQHAENLARKVGIKLVSFKGGNDILHKAAMKKAGFTPDKNCQNEFIKEVL